MRETIFPGTQEWFEQKCWEKNRRKNVQKNVFYIPSNIVTKKWWEKKARNNFSRNTRMVRAKMLGKNRRKNVRKNFFTFPRIS